MAKFVFSAFADEISADFTAQLLALNKLQIPYIELRGVNGKSFTALDDGEVREVRTALQAHHIDVWALGTPLGKTKTGVFAANQTALLRRVMDIGDALGTKRLRVFSFYPEEGDSFETFEKKAFSHIADLLEEAEKRGFILCHENEKGIYGASPQRCKTLLDHFGGRLRAALDNGNFPFAGYPAKGAFALLKDYVEYLHVKDCTADGVIVPPGHGDADIEPTLLEIDADRDGEVVLTIEPHLVGFTGLSSLSNLNDIKHKFSFATPFDAFSYATKRVREMTERRKAEK